MGDPVTHWQIVSKDPDGAAGFYKELFGWNINTANGLNYRMVDTQSEPEDGHQAAPLLLLLSGTSSPGARDRK